MFNKVDNLDKYKKLQEKEEKDLELAVALSKNTYQPYST